MSGLCPTIAPAVPGGVRGLAVRPPVIRAGRLVHALPGGQALLVGAVCRGKGLPAGVVQIQQLGALHNGRQQKAAAFKNAVLKKALHVQRLFRLGKIGVQFAHHAQGVNFQGLVRVAGKNIRHGLRVDDTHGRRRDGFFQLRNAALGHGVHNNALLNAHRLVKASHGGLQRQLVFAHIIVPQRQGGGVCGI